MGRFIITKRVNNEYQFVLEANNNKIILVSEGYNTKAGCQNGIASVKTNSPYDFRYNRRISTNNKYYFNLIAENNQVIGTSEMYNTIQSRENGITSVKTNAPTANIVDRTS
jgi:uncharacterized protein